MKITKTDELAFTNYDSEYLLNKGIDLFNEGDYEGAVEYYRLSAMLDNNYAINNLGNCYKDGIGVDANEELAKMYFIKASESNNIDSLYELGCYKKKENDIEGCKYYFSKALKEIELLNDPELELEYPELYYVMGKDYMEKDLAKAFYFLLTAKDSYEILIAEGNRDYEGVYSELSELIDMEIFDEVKEEYEAEDECDCGNDGCGCDHECHCH